MSKGLVRAVSATAIALALASGPAAASAAGGQDGAPAAPRGGAEDEVLAAASELIRSGRYARAAEELAALGDGLSPAGRALLGRALALDRRYLAAEEPLRRAVAEGRNDVATLFYLASTLWENGKLDEAETVLGRALEASGGHPAILRQLGRLALWRGDWTAAVEYLDRVLAAAPDDLDSLLDRARALAGAGRNAEAEAGFRTVVERAPDHAGARYGFGRLLLATGAEEEGRAQLETFRRLQEREQEATTRAGREQARLDRGLALLASGEAPAAVEHLRALPPTPDGLDALARALDAAGEPEEAVRALERAVAMAPERRDLRDRLTASRLALAPADG